MSWSAPDGGQMLALVDPALRSVCVYQIKPTGEIALKSVRNVNWDLQMLEFNTDSPAPREIQTLLNHR